MKKYIVKRLVQSLVCLIVVTIVVFMLTRLSGDPALLVAPPEATKADLVEIRQNLGLDKPVYVQYLRYMSDLLRGDFGKSIRWNTPCLELFLERFPNTLLLAVASMGISFLIGIPMGALSAVWVGRWFDRFGKVLALIGQALPVFWLGIMLILLFSVWLGVLPTSGMGDWRNLVLPSITLGWYFTAAMTRLTRSSMLDVLDSEYIKMSRIMGFPESVVVGRHGLKNAIPTVLTLGALNFAFLLNGTVITETVFNWPGVGRLVVNAIFSRDFPVVQTCVLIASSIFITVNLVVDIVYSYIDPRMRQE